MRKRRPIKPSPMPMPKQPSNNINLLGLLLVGGKSSRMQQPKGLLPYQNTPQWQRAVTLLQNHCSQILIGIQPENLYFWESNIAHRPFLIDNQILGNHGPATAFFTVAEFLQNQPEFDGVMILGCDYPLLTSASTNSLFSHFQGDSRLNPVCFENPNDEKPEPLLAIYTREILADYMQAYKENPQLSPRKFFENWPIQRIKHTHPEELTSVDTPEMYHEILQKMQ